MKFTTSSSILLCRVFVPLVLTGRSFQTHAFTSSRLSFETTSRSPLLIRLSTSHEGEATVSTESLAETTKTRPTTQTIEDLRGLGFPTGMCQALQQDSLRTARRFWILDNSGSMATPDGQRYIPHGDLDPQHGGKLGACTRWKELQETILYHSQLAGFLEIPTEFEFLNSPGLFQKSFVVQNSNDAVKAGSIIQRAQPIGPTPVTACVEGVRKKIQKLVPQLQKEGKQVSLVIATDGLPTDSFGYGGEGANKSFEKALASLSSLPVSTVIRLCTDDAQVVEFYNALDDRLELNIDVLDDYQAEAKEIHSKNKWLSYGLPLHRFREGGFQNRLADLLDERKLTKDELRDFAGLLYGEALVFDGLPDPQVDWGGFQQEVNHLQKYEEDIFDPISKKMTSWMRLPAFGNLLY